MFAWITKLLAVVELAKKIIKIFRPEKKEGRCEATSHTIPKKDQASENKKPSHQASKRDEISYNPDPPPEDVDLWHALIAKHKKSLLGSKETRIAALAQWALESGYGKSDLARRHRNFAGIKWRKEMDAVAVPVRYKAHDGEDSYCHFYTLGAFIVGYWRFINRKPYIGWVNYKEDAEGYIRHLAACGYATDPDYAEKVIKLLPWAREAMGYGEADENGESDSASENDSEGDEIEEDDEDNETEASHPYPIPAVKWQASPRHSSRHGSKVKGIVLHHTAGSTAEGAIHTLTAPESEGGRRASAHYVVGKDGEITQLVSTTRKAWHAGPVNAHTIGIEIVGTTGDRLTQAQDRALTELVAHELYEHGLSYMDVTGHKFTGAATACPGTLFGSQGTFEELRLWAKKRFGLYFP